MDVAFNVQLRHLGLHVCLLMLMSKKDTHPQSLHVSSLFSISLFPFPAPHESFLYTLPPPRFCSPFHSGSSQCLCLPVKLSFSTIGTNIIRKSLSVHLRLPHICTVCKLPFVVTSKS